MLALDTVTGTSPVDTHSGAGDDEGVHAFCSVSMKTWCGDDARKHETVDVPDSVDRVCRICLLAMEMWAEGEPCPICGGRACLA